MEDSKLTPSGRWTEARWLKLGDHFLTKTGKSATVSGLTIRMERVKVYNLQVTRLQLYAVGNAGIFVHDSAPQSLRVGLLNGNCAVQVSTRNGISRQVSGGGIRRVGNGEIILRPQWKA